jgi:hypothetical protein
MCLVNQLEFSGHAVAAERSALSSYSSSVIKSGQLKVLLANVRGLRQAAGELSKLVNEFKPHLLGIVETHLQGNPLSGLLPRGYRCLNRLDRTKHDGGLLWAGMNHLLVDQVNMKEYNEADVAEMIGVEVLGETLQLCYTPRSSLAPRLIEQCKQFKLDHPYKSVSFLGDFNVHNPDWICSLGDKDTGGEMAEEMCEMFGMKQLIDFPTRGENTLDLFMSTRAGSASARPGAGTSDHISINITLELHAPVPDSPIHKPTFMWQHAPWSHIRGAITRDLSNWDSNDYDSLDDAELDLDSRLFAIISKYVKLSKPKKPSPVVWWNENCQTAYKAKLKLFNVRFEKPVSYNAAVSHCRTVQNRAFSKFQNELSIKLQSMDKGDKSFWKLAKEIGGLESTRTAAAPSAQVLAEHFAKKMSNGKDVEDDDFTPRDFNSVPISSWKIREKRVKKVLQSIDASKSANGISPMFWKHTSQVVYKAVTNLFKRIVREAEYVSRWKVARVTPPHKRGSVMDAKNYRPLSVLVNLSVYFEDTVDPQFDLWMSNFIPENQFGFVKRTGTGDYGAAISCTIQLHLDNRGEGILISLDVAGAFDRVWWARVKVRLKAKGMKRKALKLIYSYLKNRFIQVVVGGDKSEELEIFSSVPQGGKWSPKLWDFDISEMESYLLSKLAMLICYADDCGLWYPITPENYHSIVHSINSDLASLLDWGEDNKTTFEPTKTHFTLISNKTTNRFNLCFPFPRIVFDGALVKRKPAVKLVGYLFDERMTWSGMISAMAKKARMRLGMLSRLRHLLDDRNMECMYCTFIRPILEYGSVQFMGAAVSHLEKLDSVQRAAEKIGRFKVESLQSRREAAAVAFTFKLLDGDGRGVLKDFAPEIMDIPVCIKRCRHSASGLQLVSRAKVRSLNAFKRSYLGSIHTIWAKLPHDLLRVGESKGWGKVTKACKRFLMGKSVNPIVLKPKWEPKTDEWHSGLKQSDAFMIASGYYFENGMWTTYDDIEN